MIKEIVIQQREILCALGTLEDTTQALLAGKTAVKEGPSFGFDTAYSPFADISFRKLVKTASFFKSRIDFSSLKFPMIFIYCSAKGDLSSIEPDAEANSSNLSEAVLDTQAKLASSILNLFPSRTTVISTACASGAAAVDYARELMEREQFASAVLFGFDPLSKFVTSGFHSLGALSASGARPFDKSRDGLHLGEGAAIAILTREDPEKGDIIVAGSGCSNDANHRTGPSRTGDGLFRAAHEAVQTAKTLPDRIGAVKCHGTATVYNDAMESKAINQLFKSTPPPCFSIKGALGHTSGAGSLMEILLAAEFIKLRSVPPTAGYGEHGVEEQLPVTNRIQKMKTRSILCLSAGFGGLNTAVILKEFE